MTKLEKLEKEIGALDREELSAFRNWFRSYDADEWDRQIESDVFSGRLNEMAGKALKEHRAGKTQEI